MSINKIFQEKNNGLEFVVFLTPGAKKEAICGIVSLNNNSALKISVHEKPTDNQANKALISFLSKKLKIAKSNIFIQKGLKSREKRIFITNFQINNLPQDFIENEF